MPSRCRSCVSGLRCTCRLRANGEIISRASQGKLEKKGCLLSSTVYHKTSDRKDLTSSNRRGPGVSLLLFGVDRTPKAAVIQRSDGVPEPKYEVLVVFTVNRQAETLRRICVGLCRAVASSCLKRRWMYMLWEV